MTAPVLTYDEIVAGLEAQGVPKAIAERTARDASPFVAGVPEPTKDDRIREKEEQAEVVKRFRAFGCVVYSLSQPRASKQTPGLPDLWVFHSGSCRAWWWETKRQVGGAFSPAQQEFRDLCGQTHVLYGSGDRYDAERFLITEGLAVRGPGGSLEPRREISFCEISKDD